MSQHFYKLTKCKNHLKRKNTLILSLLFLLQFLFINIYGQCPEAPRNVQYSSSFYRAQSYFMQRYESQNASMNVVVQGVPLGGSASSTNWATQNSSLTENEAINLIKSELTNYRAQILAEVSSVLCQISLIPNPSLVQLKAIEAIEKIASIALGNENQITNTTNSNNNFEILPSNPYVIFKTGATSNGTVLIKVFNKTAGQLPLQIEQDYQEGFPWDIRYVEQNLNFTLGAHENKLLRFYVNNPQGRTDPYTASITIKAATDNSIFGICTVNIIPSDDFFQLPIEIKNGEINEHSKIRCTARDHPEFNDAHDSWGQLPYNAGPNMGYANQTSCFAITTASNSVGLNSKKEYSWTFDMNNRLGGKCGPNGSNTGGDGKASPEYRTTINLPIIPTNSSWTIRLSGSATGDTPGGGLTNVYLSGAGVDQTFSFGRSGAPMRLEVTNLKAGQYKLQLNTAELVRGCYGGAQGTEVQTDFSTSLSVNISRIDGN